MADSTQKQILEAFRAQVLAIAAVSAILGSRLYFDAGEKPEAPYAVFEVDNSTTTTSHSGQGGIQSLDVSIETFTDSKTNAVELRDAIVGGIQGFSGDVSGTFLNRITYDGQSPYRDAASGLYGHTLDFSIQA